MLTAAVTQATLHVVVLAVLARLIRPDGFGVFQIGLALFAFAQLVAELGIGPAIVQRSTLTERHLRTGFTLSLLLGAVVAGGLVLAAPGWALLFNLPSLSPVVRALALALFFYIAASVPLALLQRKMKFKRLAAYHLASYAIGYGVVGITLAARGAQFWALVGAHVAQMAVLCLLVGITARLPRPHPIRREAARDLLAFGGAFTMAELTNYLALRADELLVGGHLGSYALGLYGRAYHLMYLPASFFAQTADKVLFPAMSEVQSEGGRLATAYRRGLTLTAAVLLPSSAVAFALAAEIVSVVLGPDWSGVVPLLRILALAMYFRTAYKVSDTLIRAAGAVRESARRQLVYAVLVIVGVMIGVQYGLIGVAIGVTLAIVGHFLSLAQLALRQVDLGWHGLLMLHARPIMVAALAGLAAWGVGGALQSLGLPTFPILLTAAIASGVCAVGFAALAPGLALGPDGLWWARTGTGLLKEAARRLRERYQAPKS